MTCKINLSMFLSLSVQLRSKTVVKKTFSKCSQIVSIVIVALLASHILTLRFSKLNFNISKMHACKNYFYSLNIIQRNFRFSYCMQDIRSVGIFLCSMYTFAYMYTGKNEMSLSLYQYFSLITSDYVFIYIFLDKTKTCL